MMTSKVGRETLSATSTPTTDPGSVQAANTSPDLKSTRRCRV
jgi:hypothetical protein